MVHNYEYKFEIRPNKFVFVPTPQTRKNGKKIVREVMQIWTPEDYFYHFGKRGGHVAAMRPHVGNSFKASLDLTKFFMNVSRAKVVRALKRAGVSSSRSFDIAFSSCVEFKGRKFIPYGFPQSMLLATMAVENSALGSQIKTLKASGVYVTMYVDDIILSHNDKAVLCEAYGELVASANQSGFEVSSKKSSPPSVGVEAFNCNIDKDISIKHDRMAEFVSQICEGTPSTKEAVLRYVDVINSSQADELNLIT